MNKEEAIEMISQLNRLINQVNTMSAKCSKVVYPPVKFELHEASARLEMCKDMMKKEIKQCSN